jgi:hypothetical protein
MAEAEHKVGHKQILVDFNKGCFFTLLEGPGDIIRDT